MTIAKTRFELAVVADQMGQRIACSFDDASRRRNQTCIRCRDDSAQYHRQVERKKRIVTPVFACAVEIDPCEKSFLIEPMRQPSERRLRTRNIGGLTAVATCHPREPIQEIPGYF